ncbi:hypothetical protein ACKS0A_04002 [Histoplasma ohiense]
MNICHISLMSPMSEEGIIQHQPQVVRQFLCVEPFLPGIARPSRLQTPSAVVPNHNREERGPISHIHRLLRPRLHPEEYVLH